MEYGKFNSAEELLKGYNELEKSFTQKCQQLSELRNRMEHEQLSAETSGTNEASSPQEKANEGNDAAMEVQVVCAVPADSNVQSAANDSPSPQNKAVEQIKQYLDANPEARALLFDKPTAPNVTPLPKVMASGGNVSLTLPTKPKTIKEASVLAKKLFEN